MKVYGFAIGQLPHPLFHPRQAKKAAAMLNGLDGLKGVYEHLRGATILFFEELNDAKRARNVIRATGRAVGNNIMECEANEVWSEVKVMRPVE